MARPQAATTADRSSPPPGIAPDQPLLAIGFLLGANFVFTAMDGFAKGLAGSGMAAEQIILLRYALVSVLLVPAVLRHWYARPWRTSRPVAHIARGVLLIGSATLFVHAMVHLPLETATAIGFVSPLYVTALSIPFLGEKVGIRRWAAVGAGFVGVLLILRPGSDVFQLAMLLPLVSSLCWAAGLILTRQMRGTEGPLTILIWSTVSGLVAIIPLGILDWRNPTPAEWSFLVAIAICHVAGQYLTIRAFMLASASLIAPFSYSTLVWAILIGVFAFGSYPDAPTLIGGALLVAAGIYVWHRERLITGMPTNPGGSIAEVAEASKEDR
ncbi:acetylornithine deacetylase [alpha proteobacterium BAL199]|jgi:drug/metabolite transporter (DMT)-like permease|nr:acetylornithine deacetylase [alpha proteobacterium BAL199]